MLGEVDAQGRLDSEVTLTLSGKNLDDGRTLVLAQVSARRAGPMLEYPSAARHDGNIAPIMRCPTATRTGFTGTVTLEPGQTRTLGDIGDAQGQGRIKVTATSP